MIDPALYLAFLGAVIVLILIPGPNVALIVANSVAYGPRYGLLTVAGTSTAMIPQLVLAALGLSGLMHTMGVWFEVLRWIGAVYLVWLGLRQWFAPVSDLSAVRAERRSPRRIFLRALLVSLTNPKTLLFYGAFFPQFISSNYDAGPQVIVLSVTFLVMAIVFDSVWALGASHARRLLMSHVQLRNRITGVLLMGAGIGMAFARNK